MIKEEISDLKKTLDNHVEEKKKVVEIVDLLFLCLKTKSLVQNKA